jgi:hypothetical protein
MPIVADGVHTVICHSHFPADSFWSVVVFRFRFMKSMRRLVSDSDSI